MNRLTGVPAREGVPGSPVLDAGPLLQLKVWLLGISPMVWRRISVPESFTLRELHGVLQVAMGWEGIHLFQFCLRAGRYGSWELSAASPEVTLAELQLRKGARFVYEYDLNIPWRHEIRLEGRLEPEIGRLSPSCIGGAGHCPSEECGGPAAFMDSRNSTLSWSSFEDLRTIADIVGKVVLEGRTEALQDEETHWELEGALDRGQARERAKGKPFSRRTINNHLRRGEHLQLMHQRY